MAVSKKINQSEYKVHGWLLHSYEIVVSTKAMAWVSSNGATTLVNIFTSAVLKHIISSNFTTNPEATIPAMRPNMADTAHIHNLIIIVNRTKYFSA